MIVSNDNEEYRINQANRITYIGSISNLFLTVFKFIAGVLGNSGAMIADAIHSLSDFATDVVIIMSFKIVAKPADKEHDYGHGKFETLATTIIGTVLLFVGLGILYNGGKNIYNAIVLNQEIPRPEMIALIAALISIVLKEGVYRYTIKTGKKINSQAVIANAWHHRSDAFSSVGTFIGIGCAILLGDKWRILDPIAAVIVSLLIIKVAYEIALGSLKELLEQSLDEETEKNIDEIVNNTEGVISSHNLKTRRIGNNIAIDIHIRVNKDLTVVQAHSITEIIEKNIREKYGRKTFISIHTEPEKF